MFVANSEETYKTNEIITYLPKRIRKYMYFAEWDELEEIRLRLGLPVTLQYRDAMFFLNDKGAPVLFGDKLLRVTKQDIDEAIELISRSSYYAHENDIKNGYITIPGGNRVGISGNGVIKSGEVTSLKNISSLNYRIAHEITGASDRLIDMICDGGKIKNTLIISPPECGKTTLLRDIARNLSNMRKKISIADERGEIAAAHDGFCGYDLGNLCDVMTDIPKSRAMIMLLRSMSPDVIITDELGKSEDIGAAAEIINSGVSIIATVHANDEKQLRNRKSMSELADFFKCFIVLSRRFGAGTIEEAYCVD